MSPESTTGFAAGNPANFTDKVSAAASEAKARAAELAGKADQAADEARSRAAAGLGSAAEAVEGEAQEGAQTIRRAGRRAADALATSANYIRDNSARDMFEDAMEVVKDNPGVALLGAVAIGFLVGRAFSSRN